MDIARKTTGGVVVLSLAGRLDTATAPQLEEELLPALAKGDVTLDFSGVDYVSSAGLRVLLLGEKAAKAGGRAFVLTGVGETVYDILEMTGFSQVLKVIRA